MGLPKSGALGPNPPWVKERGWSSRNTSIPTELGAVHILYNAQQGGRVANNLLYALYEG